MTNTISVPRDLLLALRDSANDCYNNEATRYKDERRMAIYKAQVQKADELLAAAPKADVQDEVPCSTHPDAPHGFNRDSSHSLDRYVCDCEGWVPPVQEPVSDDARVSKMARILSDRLARDCYVDLDDHWKFYGQELIDDVRAMLEGIRMNWSMSCM